MFGSALREDFRAKSDLDVLVEFEAEHTPGLIGLAGMENRTVQVLGEQGGHEYADLPEPFLPRRSTGGGRARVCGGMICLQC